MAQAYQFVISMPVSDMLPRNRISNSVHFQHVSGGLLDTDLEAMCDDLVAMYQARYHVTTKEIQCKAYDVDAKPNYPRAETIVNAGQFWQQSVPRELALCLSFSGPRRGNRHERGRIYLNPAIEAAAIAPGLRPGASVMTWALDFYTVPNESFPDIGGIDWKFGVWSRKYQTFRQTTQAWVNDEWDIQRRRGLRESTRQSVARDG